MDWFCSKVLLLWHVLLVMNILRHITIIPKAWRQHRVLLRLKACSPLLIYLVFLLGNEWKLRDVRHPAWVSSVSSTSIVAFDRLRFIRDPSPHGTAHSHDLLVIVSSPCLIRLCDYSLHIHLLKILVGLRGFNEAYMPGVLNAFFALAVCCPRIFFLMHVALL